MKRLLIIEDDYNTLIGLQELLTHKGYEVKGVTNGASAIEMIEDESIDIILCDYRLPDTDGNRLCRQLKEMQPQLVILVITAYNQPELVDLVKDAVIEEVFYKPLQLEVLYQTLEAHSTTRQRRS